MKLFHQYFEIFGDEVNRELYRLALSKNDNFSLSKTSFSKHYPEWRQSKVIYDREFNLFKIKIEEEIKRRLPEVLEMLEVRKFEIASFEVQLTSHNDGEFYKWHRDNSTAGTASRVVTFVYYFNAIPKKFSGGELVIYHHDGQESFIEPLNDSMIFFNSATKHEVKPVICPSKLFEDGRFTLNGWIRKRQSITKNDEYFGYNIFKPYANSLV